MPKKENANTAEISIKESDLKNHLRNHSRNKTSQQTDNHVEQKAKSKSKAEKQKSKHVEAMKTKDLIHTDFQLYQAINILKAMTKV